jgi:hypothetical protein
MVASGLGNTGSSTQYFIPKRYSEALGQIATGAQKRVFLPYETSGVMAALGGIRELLIADATPEGNASLNWSFSLAGGRHSLAAAYEKNG